MGSSIVTNETKTKKMAFQFHSVCNPDEKENATGSIDPSSKSYWLETFQRLLFTSIEFLRRTFRKSQKLPTRGKEPSLILQKLSVQDEQRRANILSKLHNEPVSDCLLAYFERLKQGSLVWDIETFIEGAKRFADLGGPERVQYYGNKLSGLHYPNSFAEVWNRTHPQQPITVWDNFEHQCPPSWSYNHKDFHWVLSYQGEAPMSEALNELLQGPTTLCCGIFSELVPWMATRYLIGDELFDKFFKFGKGQFILTGAWDIPTNNAGTVGNLLHPFYDHPLQHERTHPLESQTRLQTRSVFNHPAYLAKHPGGLARLHNVTQIDDNYIIFDPQAPQNVLTKEEVERTLIQAYNAPRSLADKERMWLYAIAPDFIHPHFAPKSFGTLAEEARKYENHTLGESEWKDSQLDREKKEQQLHLIFNFQRLMSCLHETKDAHSNGEIYEDVMARARRLKREAERGGHCC